VIDQEMAGIIKFILDTVDLKPYYEDVREKFVVPSVFFPLPEIMSSCCTLGSYKISYMWFVKFFGTDKTQAHRNASHVMYQLISKRLMITLYDKEGNKTFEKLRINQPRVKILDDTTCQLTIEWNSVRHYENEIYPQMDDFILEG